MSTDVVQGNLFKIAMGVIQALSLVILGWIVTDMREQRTNIGELNVAVAAMQVTVNGLSNNVKDRYTRQDAVADRRNQSLIDQSQERDIARVEARVELVLNKLEDAIEKLEVPR